MRGQGDDEFLESVLDSAFYAAGHADGYAGDRISEEAFPEPGYRRGLSDGRTQRIDERLQAAAVLRIARDDQVDAAGPTTYVLPPVGGGSSEGNVDG
jgi:hypothetical protein